MSPRSTAGPVLAVPVFAAPFFAALFFAALFAAACRGEVPWRAPLAGEARMLQRAATDLRKAVAEKNGALAKIRLSAASLGVVDRARRAALHMPAAELRTRPIVTQVRALTMRARYGEALTGMLSDTVDRLVMDGALLLPRDLDRIASGAVPLEIRGDEARCRAVLGDESETAVGSITLRQEAGAWRFDLESLDAALGRELRGADEAAILRRVGELAGRPLDAAIWQPLR